MELARFGGRRCQRLRRQSGRLHRPGPWARTRAPRGGRRSVVRRRAQQLLVEPPLDLRDPRRPQAVPGRAVLRRQRGSPGRQPGRPRAAGLRWTQRGPGAGDRDRRRHAVQLPRQQAAGPSSAERAAPPAPRRPPGGTGDGPGSTQTASPTAPAGSHRGDGPHRCGNDRRDRAPPRRPWQARPTATRSSAWATSPDPGRARADGRAGAGHRRRAREDQGRAQEPGLVPERATSRDATAGRSLSTSRAAARRDRPGPRRTTRRATVTESYTGYKVAWTMARGYDGAFGRRVNSPWIWIPLTVAFVVPFVESPPTAADAAPRPARARRLRRLLALLQRRADRQLGADRRPAAGSTCSSACSGSACAVATTGARDAPLPLLVPVAWLAIARDLPDRVPGRAQRHELQRDRRRVRGRHRRATGCSDGERLYGAFPTDNEHGDTYGPVTYAAYVPFEHGARRGPGAGTTCPAAHAAAIAFDLSCCVLLFPARPPDPRARSRDRAGLRVGWRTRSRSTRRTPTPTTPWSRRCSCSSLLVAASPAARGAMAALGGLTKLATLAVAPLIVTHAPRGRRRGSSPSSASASWPPRPSCLLPVFLDGPSLAGRVRPHDRLPGRPRRAVLDLGALRPRRPADGLAGGRRRARAGLAVVPRRRDLVGLAAARRGGPDRAAARRDVLVLPLHRLVLPARRRGAASGATPTAARGSWTLAPVALVVRDRPRAPVADDASATCSSTARLRRRGPRRLRPLPRLRVRVPAAGVLPIGVARRSRGRLQPRDAGVCARRQRAGAPHRRGGPRRGWLVPAAASRRARWCAPSFDLLPVALALARPRRSCSHARPGGPARSSGSARWPSSGPRCWSWLGAGLAARSRARGSAGRLVAAAAVPAGAGLLAIVLAGGSPGAPIARRFHLERPVQIESTPAHRAVRARRTRTSPGIRSVPDRFKSNGVDGGAARTSSAAFAVAAARGARPDRVAASRDGGHATPCCSPRSALVLAFVALGKVLSPQYLLWLLPLAALVAARGHLLPRRVRGGRGGRDPRRSSRAATSISSRGGRIVGDWSALRNVLLLAALAATARAPARSPSARRGCAHAVMSTPMSHGSSSEVSKRTRMCVRIDSIACSLLDADHAAARAGHPDVGDVGGARRAARARRRSARACGCRRPR